MNQLELDARTLFCHKDLKKLNNYFLLFYGIGGSKVLNFLVTLGINKP